ICKRDRRVYQWALDEALGAGTARGMPASPGRPGNGPAGGSRGGGGPWIIDAYAGIGTLALLAAARLGLGRRGAGGAGRRTRGRVTAIEVVPAATADAEANAAFNGIEDVEFVTGRVEEVLPALARETAGGGRPDVILLDPPRKGCEPEALAACLELAPPRIVYVSCNPATLARDLAVLCDTGSAAAPPVREAGRRTRRYARYRLVRVQPVDLFPQTAHVECVASLERVE
ncbi:MAG: 23S rRNA (uracil(1939)-C(5))-methyltransferase RlmD, partial [Bacillota bacterium]